jgi:hypothetical protein
MGDAGAGAGAGGLAARAGAGVGGALGGALLGLCVSFLVNEALYEISVNGFFAVVFGSALLFMGGLILYRVSALSWQSATSSSSGKQSASTYFVMAFAVLVVVAGLFCFFLEKDWFKFISPSAKIPMYTLLGVALWFALTFSIMDLFNFVGQYLVLRLSKGRRLWQPIVSTPVQICLVLGVAVLLGLFFGVIFGSFDVEDTAQAGLQKDFGYTLPVGAATCAVVGAINQAWLRPPLPAASQDAGNGTEGDYAYAPRGKAAYDDGI